MAISFYPSPTRWLRSTKRHELRQGRQQTHISAPRTFWLSSQRISTRLSTRQRHLITSISKLPVRPKWPLHAGAMDAMPAWTLDQIAGLMFGPVIFPDQLSWTIPCPSHNHLSGSNGYCHPQRSPSGYNGGQGAAAAAGSV
ncbi:hypothetical protein Vretimale_12589 [Volvox reticuliferus]|uniref:Uncharacterized protein n=1 Tax=Volvox reticuliferus TaxID=1737510 RepID=A0A8J4LSS5_9CHLO|nr:hypothetical protein Vretimale_12589 [Volvox reticuliferus]